MHPKLHILQARRTWRPSLAPPRDRGAGIVFAGRGKSLHKIFATGTRPCGRESRMVVAPHDRAALPAGVLPARSRRCAGARQARVGGAHGRRFHMHGPERGSDRGLSHGARLHGPGQGSRRGALGRTDATLLPELPHRDGDHAPRHRARVRHPQEGGRAGKRPARHP